MALTKAQISRNHRKEIKMKTNYFPTKEEGNVMSFCISKGYRCYPRCVKSDKNTLMTLEVQYMDKDPIRSKKEPFDKKFLTYNVIQVYKQIFKKLKS